MTTGLRPGLTRDERMLVEGCRRGDEAAWLAVYRAYGGDVGRFLKGMLRQSSEIDDIVQRVFLEFLSSLDRFRGDSSLRTWLLRIARNLALREIRSKSRREHYVRAYAETVGEHAASPEGQVIARHHLQQIHQLLGEVDESFREVWLLRELGGCDVAEVAAILEIEPATVRSRHHRARRRLMELLQRFDQTPTPQQRHLKLVGGKGRAS